MEQESYPPLLLIGITLVVAIIGAVIVKVVFKPKPSSSTDKQQQQQQQHKGEEETQEKPKKDEEEKEEKKKEPVKNKEVHKVKDVHERLVMKDHPDTVLVLKESGVDKSSTIEDVQVNENGIVICPSNDHFCVIFRRIPPLAQKSKQERRAPFKSSKIPIGSEHYPTSAAMSIDSDYLAIALDYVKRIQLHHLEPQNDTDAKGITSKNILFKESKGSLQNELKYIKIAPNKRWIVTIAEKDDRIYFWSLKDGSLLHSLHTGLLNISSMDISFNSKYIALSGFLSDIRIFQVHEAEGEFDVHKYREIIGHKSTVQQIHYHPQMDQMLASISNDGTFQLYDCSDMKGRVNYKDTDRIYLEKKASDLTNGRYDRFDSVEYSPDGQKILLHSRNVLFVLDVTSCGLNKSDYEKKGDVEREYDFTTYLPATDSVKIVRWLHGEFKKKRFLLVADPTQFSLYLIQVKL